METIVGAVWSVLSLATGLFLLLVLGQIFLGMFSSYINQFTDWLRDMLSPIKPSAKVDGKKISVEREDEHE